MNTRSILRRSLADPIRVQKFFQKLGIPRAARDEIVVKMKSLLAPNEVRDRKATAARSASPKGIDVERFRTDGAVLLKPTTIPQGKAAAASAYRLFEVLQEQGKVKKPHDERKGSFLITLMSDEELLVDEFIAAFVLSDEVLGLASCYFCEVPILSGIRFWWSPPNQSKLESQLYHYDGEDKSQLKILLNVNDVDDQTGPFTYLPSRQSVKVQRGKRHSQRLTDETVDEVVGPGATVHLTGPSGSMAAVDTSRCLHYGSRGNTRERLIVMAQFTRFLAPKARMPNWKQPVGQLGELQRMALNLQ